MAVIINNKKVAGVGKPGVPGKSAYELAKQTGYEGTELDLSLALNNIGKINTYIDDNFVSYTTNQELNNEARLMARNNIGIYIQDTEPVDAADGDLWISEDINSMLLSFGEMDKIIGGLATLDNNTVSLEDLDNAIGGI